MYGIYTHSVAEVVKKRVAGLKNSALQIGFAVTATNSSAQRIVAPAIAHTWQTEVTGVLNDRVLIGEAVL